MRRIAIALTSLALVAAMPAGAQQSSPRAVVETVAAAIERNYFDPARAAQIAAELRKAAKGGAFDRMPPAQLATALTTRLRPLDGHFAVDWSDPAEVAAPVAGSGPAPARYGFAEIVRRSGHGFRRAEILPGNIGLIEMSAFANIDFKDPNAPALRAVDGALAMVADADAILLDLRANGGGEPSMVGYLTSAFVPLEADVYNQFHSRTGTESERPAFGYRGKRITAPLYVLIGPRTASAAEAFAYTVQAAKRGVVVGQPSAGAANPGEPVALPGGYSVFVSTGTPINPVTKGNWEGKGVQPDVAAGEDALLRARILALETSAKTIPEAERIDAQRVLEALQAEAAPPAGIRSEAYVGSYQGLVISSRDGRLFARRGQRAEVALAPIRDGLFYPVAQPAVRYMFTPGVDGRIQMLSVSAPGGPRSEFVKD